MMDVGVVRFEIIDPVFGPGAKRFEDARRYHAPAVTMYQQIFNRLGMPLKAGYRVIRCSKMEFEAGYDYQLGIDVILTTRDDEEFTLQEKFLFQPFECVTVEYEQDAATGQPGDWFHLRSQFYFVWYPITGKWIMLNWPATKMMTARREIYWEKRLNGKDSARASMKVSHFKNFRPPALVANHSGAYQKPLEFEFDEVAA